MRTPEKRREKKRAYYIATREKRLAQVRAYKAAHADQVRTYRRAYRAAHPERALTPREWVRDFEPHVLPLTGDMRCWEWHGKLNKNGYGLITVDGVTRSAHRIAWLTCRGPIPADKELDHVVCSKKFCVNPPHMEPVSHAENIRRAWRDMRKAKRD